MRRTRSRPGVGNDTLFGSVADILQWWKLRDHPVEPGWVVGSSIEDNYEEWGRISHENVSIDVRPDMTWELRVHGRSCGVGTIARLSSAAADAIP